MAEKENSYSYVNLKRDVSEVFETIIQSRPALSNLIQIRGEATAKKHEWLEDVVTPKSWVTNGTYTTGDLAVTLASADGLVVGSIVKFELATGASTTLTAKVTAIDGLDVTFVVYGDNSTDQDMTTGAIMKLVSIPKIEGTDATANDGREPVTEYNYTQIFDRTAKVSKTAQAVEKYGIDSAIDFQVETQLFDIAYEVVNTVIYSQRVQRSGNEAGTMGGILYFLEKATGNKVDASGEPLTGAMISEGLAKSNENGAININLGIGHPNQTRKISAEMQNQVQISREDQARGTFVTTYIGDLGDVITLIADRNFSKDKFALVDGSKVSLVPLRAFTDEDATANGADYFARRILGEYTLEVRNAQIHTLITGLAL